MRSYCLGMLLLLPLHDAIAFVCCCLCMYYCMLLPLPLHAAALQVLLPLQVLILWQAAHLHADAAAAYS